MPDFKPPEPARHEAVAEAIGERARAFAALAALAPEIVAAADMMIAALSAGGKVMLCGNGGSAADCQHIAAELTGRFLKERPPLAAVALTVDTSALTAIGNDYGYPEVFARQVRALGRPGDVLIAISTSGNSANVIEAVGAARALGIGTIALTGAKAGRMEGLADLALRVPAARTDRIQEMHIAVGHLLCGLVEDALH